MKNDWWKCIHLGEYQNEYIECSSCRGNVLLKVFACEKYSKCTLVKWVGTLACCNGKIINGTHYPCDGFEYRNK